MMRLCSVFTCGTLGLTGLLGVAGCPLDDDYVISPSSAGGAPSTTGVGGAAGAGGGGGAPGAGAGGGCGPDPTPPAGLPCPAQCTTCNEGTCTISCNGPGECSFGVLCPPDFNCVVECMGYRACRDATITCPADYDCKIQCGGGQNETCERSVFQCSAQGRCDIECGSQNEACKDADLNCGMGGCSATCTGADNVKVSCMAESACCPDPAACPP